MINPRFNRQIGVVLFLLAGCSTGMANDAEQMVLGRKLFQTATPACAVCHTLKDAEAQGAVGPVLDEIKPDVKRVMAALNNGIGQMPAYKALLTEEQIQLLAQYVAKASGAVK
jgi:cytochrome c6